MKNKLYVYVQNYILYTITYSICKLNLYRFVTSKIKLKINMNFFGRVNLTTFFSFWTTSRKLFGNQMEKTEKPHCRNKFLIIIQ